MTEQSGNNKEYYATKLGGARLEQVYRLAGERVERYLRAESELIAGMIAPGDKVLELGCGYGRVLASLSGLGGELWGIDNSADSLALAAERHPELAWRLMDAEHLDFAGNSFDLVFGVQNFISACKVEPVRLLREALRVARPGKRVVFTSYTAEFWPYRLEWFRRQAKHGLLGEIDEEATGSGVIACRDGFRATTLGSEDFKALLQACRAEGEVYEIDGSSLVLEARAAR